VAHFLLLHGACHGGWCFDELAARLRSAGHGVTAPDLPCDDPDSGLPEYRDAAVRALDGRPDELVVVGHSLGALVVPLIATAVPTRRMVMLAGIVGAPNSSLESLADEDADRDLPLGDDGIEFNERGLFRFTSASARRLLYPDCAPDVAESAIARLRYQRSMWTQVAEFDAWPDVETVSIVCDEDLVVNPAWSDRVARERLDVEPIRLPGGHSPFLSRPDDLAEVLLAGL
jgi:pimeloyl-ACP methyl ester carboxylesterase